MNETFIETWAILEGFDFEEWWAEISMFDNSGEWIKHIKIIKFLKVYQQ